MSHTPAPIQNASFAPPPVAMGSFQIKHDSAEHARFEGSNPSRAKSHNGPGSRGPTSNPSHETRADIKHATTEKELAISDAGFQAPNNDDSAIDLEEDPMMIAVGKYGDMMASDPADAEGDVVVI